MEKKKQITAIMNSEMENLLKWLKLKSTHVDEIYTSSSLRAIQSARILSKEEYIGKTENFRTHKKSYKCNKRIENNPSKLETNIMTPKVFQNGCFCQ